MLKHNLTALVLLVAFVLASSQGVTYTNQTVSQPVTRLGLTTVNIVYPDSDDVTVFFTRVQSDELILNVSVPSDRKTAYSVSGKFQGTTYTATVSFVGLVNNQTVSLLTNDAVGLTRGLSVISSLVVVMFAGPKGFFRTVSVVMLLLALVAVVRAASNPVIIRVSLPDYVTTFCTNQLCISTDAIIPQTTTGYLATSTRSSTTQQQTSSGAASTTRARSTSGAQTSSEVQTSTQWTSEAATTSNEGHSSSVFVTSTGPYSSTQQITSTEDFTSTVDQSTTIAGTSSEAATSTEAQTTSEATTSTEAQTTSEATTSTEAQTTSEATTSTEAQTTSEATTSTEAQTTSEASTSTEAQTTSEASSTSTEAQTTSEASTSTEAQTTSEASTSTEAQTTSEATTSTEAQTTSEASTSTEAQTTSEASTSTEAQTTSEATTSTEAQTTSEAETTEAETTSVSASSTDQADIINSEFQMEDVNFVGISSALNPGVRLTDLRYTKSGAFWFKPQLNITKSFSVKFQFKITQPQNGGADGFTFALQNQGQAPIGAYGSDLGISGITQCVAVTFVTQSATDRTGFPGDNFISFQANPGGAIDTKMIHSKGYIDSPVQMNNGDAHEVQIQYDGSQLTVIIDDEPGTTLSVSADLASLIGSNVAYMGFTAGTGGLSQYHDILSFNYQSL